MTGPKPVGATGKPLSTVTFRTKREAEQFMLANGLAVLKPVVDDPRNPKPRKLYDRVTPSAGVTLESGIAHTVTYDESQIVGVAGQKSAAQAALDAMTPSQLDKLMKLLAEPEAPAAQPASEA